MIKKIIYFRYLPLTKKIFEDFYIADLSKAGYDVEYWYLPFIISQPEGMEVFEAPCYKTIDSYVALDEALRHEDNSSVLYISIMTYEGAVFRVFWMMTKYDCKIAVFGKNTLPFHLSSINIKKLFSLPFERILSSLKNRVACKLKDMGVVKSYDVLFLAGTNGINGYGHTTSLERYKSKKFLVNSDDYDRAILYKRGNRFLQEEFIVFLDECMPLHPDIGICGIDVMDADTYYKELNDFFDKVEKKTGIPVVIAAHPKALIYKNKDYFNGRMVFFDKTVELVRDSKLVLAHDSTAIGYAVCFEKPIISMTSDEMALHQPSNYRTILFSSESLGTQLVYINKEETLEFLDNSDFSRLINYDKYVNYKYTYLTNPETEDTFSSELFIKALKQL